MSRAIVVHHDDHEEEFLRDTLLLSIYDSLRHRKTAIQDATALTSTIIGSVIDLVHDSSINSSQITATVHATLLRFDTIAAMHYKAFHP
ncbi:MAG: hypothetical protein NVSMB46_01080 [Candidatus Saccharimonadales bacterium]